tara:strand:- start:592 stop:801 length:210 start_codon:yes stop_codon:yes gene_type:complete
MRGKKIPQQLAEDIIEYYFNNPQTNGNKEMVKLFNVNHTTLSNIISQELKRRRENSITRKWMHYEFCNK